MIPFWQIVLKMQANVSPLNMKFLLFEIIHGLLEPSRSLDRNGEYFICALQIISVKQKAEKKTVF